MMNMSAALLFSMMNLVMTVSAAEPLVRPIAAGAGTQGFPGKEYCQAFFIRKESGDWINVSSANLEDDNVERLRGCVDYKAARVISTATFALNTQGLCEKGRNASPRSKGYFLCNSNFANKGIFGAMKADAPFDQKSFDAALNSHAIQAAATELAQALYQKLLRSSLSADESCGECNKEVGDIRYLFDYFYPFASGPDLENLAVKYVSLTGIKKLPDWAAVRFSLSELDSVAIKGEQAWRHKYEEQAKAALDPNSEMNLLQAFISERKIADANNWRTTDFSGLLPKAKQLLQAKEDADRKETAAAIKRISAEMRTLQNSNQPVQSADPMAECIRRYRANNDSSARKHYALQHGISEAGWDANQDTEARWQCKRELGYR